MPILDHEHQIKPTDGRLLFPEEIKLRGLDLSKRYYISGRCNLPGCDFIQIGTIEETKVRHFRSPHKPRSKKR